jgi:hypothetical protein
VLLLVGGFLLILLGSVISRRYARRRWGDYATEITQAGRRDTEMARASGVPPWASFIVMMGYIGLAAGGLVLLIDWL